MFNLSIQQEFELSLFGLFLIFMEEMVERLSNAIHITHIDRVYNFFNAPGDGTEQPAVETRDEASETEADAVAQHENLVFRKFVDRKVLDMEALYSWIAQSFLPRLTANYEWFALYRVLRDANLFESGKSKVSHFADQMSLWFPDAPYPCVAGEVRRYNRGYLGNHPYADWDRKEFRTKMEDKQSMDGFTRLDDLCGLLSVELAEALKSGALLKV